MDIEALLSWLESSRLAEFIQLSAWAFPAIESVHVISLVLVLGTIAVVDLRLLGVASRGRPVTELAREILPWTWGAFVLAAISGTLMFISNAGAYFGNFSFQAKFILMGVVGLNMLVFQLLTMRSIARWDRGPAVPIAGRLAGAVSLSLWIAIVAFGRWIGFTMIDLPF